MYPRFKGRIQRETVTIDVKRVCHYLGGDGGDSREARQVVGLQGEGRVLVVVVVVRSRGGRYARHGGLVHVVRHTTVSVRLWREEQWLVKG